MSLTFPELPDWSFDADEVSAGVYRAFGHDCSGRTVEVSGLDPEALIQKCRQAAIELIAKTHPKADLSKRDKQMQRRNWSTLYWLTIRDVSTSLDMTVEF